MSKSRKTPAPKTNARRTPAKPGKRAPTLVQRLRAAWEPLAINAALERNKKAAEDLDRAVKEMLKK